MRGPNYIKWNSSGNRAYVKDRVPNPESMLQGSGFNSRV